MTTPVRTLVVEPGGAHIHTRIARRPLERLVGLLGRPLPPSGSGLWIEPCRAVHTFAMRAAIDIVFVSRSGVVERVCESVAPWRVRGECAAWSVLELRSGDARTLQLRRGVRLRWKAVQTITGDDR